MDDRTHWGRSGWDGDSDGDSDCDSDGRRAFCRGGRAAGSPRAAESAGAERGRQEQVHPVFDTTLSSHMRGLASPDDSVTPGRATRGPEARRRSHEPTVVGTEHDLGWPGSALDWCNMPGRIRVTRLPRWSKESDAGQSRTRLDRVEGGDSLRTGPSRTTNQDVPLERLECRYRIGHTPVSYTIAPVHVPPYNRD
jgi:hypothetical protein